MYLKRKADIFLNDWFKDTDRLPLIIRGARQVGKTETIRHFAKNKYKNFIEINFVEEPIFKGIIEEGYSPKNIIKLISRINPKYKFKPNETLIFFDEIQEFPEIATSLKFFSIEKKYDIICSGSLLGINQNRIESNSVGYKSDYNMRSFDFEEFLWAMGYDDNISDDFLSHMKDFRPFTQLELDKYFSLFTDYILLGGMPKVIHSFVLKNTFETAHKIQKQLILDYKEDIQKYANSLDKKKIISVFNHIPVQLSKENKKFQLSKINKNARSREYFGCINWLIDAGVIYACYAMNFPELPLKGNYDETKYKLYIADTGLLISMLDEEVIFDLRNNKNLGIYKGALFENFMAEALMKSGYDLYYYKKENSTLEIDFLVRTTDSLVPIEVKSENSSSKSLNSIISSDKYPNIKTGIKFAKANIGKSNNIITFPYFSAFLLKKYLTT